MRVIILLVAIFGFFSIDSFAQIKQAQKSYLRDKGAFINPGFDQGYKGWTITGCTKSLESDIPTYGKTLKLTCTNETFSVKQETTSYAGFGLEGLSSCKVKASAAGGKVRQIINGTPAFAYEATTVGDYKNHEEFITFGATSNGLEVYADANYTGTIFIEDCYISPKPDGSYKLPVQNLSNGKFLATDGTSESWREVNQKINYITNPGAESLDSTWVDYKNTVNGTFPDDFLGTPDAGFTGITRNVSGPLRGSASWSMDLTMAIAGNAQGHGSYKSFVLDKADIAQQMNVCFAYDNSDPLYSYGDLVVFIYDEDLSSFIRMDGESIPSGIDNQYCVTFKGNAASDNYRIGFHYAGTQKDFAPRIDDISISIIDYSSVSTVSGAHFVGSIKYASSGCYWDNTTTSMDSFGAQVACNGVVMGSSLTLPDTKIPAVKLPNVRSDGVYTISVTGVMQAVRGSSSTVSCRYGLSSDSVAVVGGNTYMVENSESTNSIANISATFRFNDNNPKTIELLASDNGTTAGSGLCRFFGRDDDLASTFDVHFYPDDKSTIVTQRSAIDPEKAGFVIYSSGDISESSTWKKANGQCLRKTDFPDYMKNVGIVHGECNYNSEGVGTGFNVADVMTDNRFIRGTDGSTLALGLTQTDQFQSHTHGILQDNNGGSLSTGIGSSTRPTQRDYTQSTDAAGGAGETRPNAIALIPYVRMFDASNLIVGKFENINSSELVKVDAKNNSGEVITSLITDTVWSTEDEDNYNAWNGSQFTSPKTTCYDVNATVRSTTNSQSQLRIFVDGVSTGEYKTSPASYIIRSYIFSNVCLNENEVMSFRPDTTQTLQSDSSYHRIQITENPDTESIIKNLSNQKTKCQTKYLSADVSSTGNIGDLEFSNLKIGKRYSAKMHLDLFSLGTVNQYVYVRVYNGGSYLFYPRLQLDVAPNAIRGDLNIDRKITATATTLGVNIETIAPTMNILSGAQYSSLELCELPDTVIETTEFN